MKNVGVLVPLEPELKNKLQARARLEGLFVTVLLRKIIQEYLRTDATDHLSPAMKDILRKSTPRVEDL